MNTKIKARVIESVGRPVGVLPLDPRPKQNRRIPSNLSDVRNKSFKLSELKPQNKTNLNSTGTSTNSASSIRSIGSAGSSGRSGSSGHSGKSRTKVTPPKTNSGKSKRTVSAVSDNSNYGSDSDNDDGQDVKFYNMVSARSRPSTSMEEPFTKTSIDPQEILLMNQEKDYNKIYEIIQHGVDLTEISSLNQFKRLKILDLSCNHIQKITGLSDNTDLKELKLYDNRISIIENLDSLKDLSCLQLQHNKIKTIGKGLTQLKKLKTLRLDSNLLLKLDSSDFVSCIQITSLDLSFNMLDNLSALSYLPNLDELSVSGNRLRKISDLSRCKKLIEVDVSNNRITDLSGLTGLAHLQILKLSNNQITSFSSASKIKSLEELDVSCNKISDLSPLSVLYPRLQILNITNNKISHWNEVLSLVKLEDLVELFISGNPFSEENGEKTQYFTETTKLLSKLEILDGAHIKKSGGKTAAPLMRPMSASTVVSVRQMDNHLKAVSEELSDLQTSISQRFESLRTTCLSLPAEAPPPTDRSTISTPNNEPEFRSCSSSRSRIRQAQEFAASQSFS